MTRILETDQFSLELLKSYQGFQITERATVDDQMTDLFEKLYQIEAERHTPTKPELIDMAQHLVIAYSLADDAP